MKKIIKALILRNHLGEIIGSNMHAKALIPPDVTIQSQLNHKGYWQGKRQVIEKRTETSCIYRLQSKPNFIDLEIIYAADKLLKEPLTQLMHAPAFLDEVKLAIKKQNILALIVLDIDDFKNINDLYGHQIGNKILIEVARRIEDLCQNNGVCARPGGDEFCILLYKTKNFNLFSFCQKLKSHFQAPITINHIRYQLHASIGIAIYPKDGKSHIKLLEHADLAMYEIKKNGKNGFCFYTKKIQSKARNQLKFEVSIKNAIQANEFEIFVQNIYDLKTQQCQDAEFILRWRHPKQGLIQPSNFLKKIKNSNLLILLDDWVLTHALERISSLSQTKSFHYFINIAATEFQANQHNLDIWIDTLSCHPQAHHIILEITEDALITYSSKNLKNLRRLQKTGINFAIDDFGEGYSNFMNIKKIKAKYLKINQDLVKNSHKKLESSIILAIIQMAHSLKLKVIAEGIETEEQMKNLRRLNCDYGQGYYFSHPLPFEEFAKQLNTLPDASTPS